MCKASQSIIIIAALILLMGAGGCGLKLVTQPGDNQVITNTTTDVSNGSSLTQQIGGRGIAAQWIQDNAPTYKFDGENLQFMQSVALTCSEDSIVYEFTFDSRNGGYGNRVNEALDNVKIAHTIRVTLQSNTVKSVITDGRFDEMTGQFGDLSADTSEQCL